MITVSTEWQLERQRYCSLIRERPYQHRQQLQQMLNNIDRRVSDLSRAEVLVRQGRVHAAEEPLKKLHTDLAELDEFIVLSNLIT